MGFSATVLLLAVAASEQQGPGCLQFFDGLVQGLENSPGESNQCVSDTQFLGADVQSVCDYVQSAVAGQPDALEDLLAASQQLADDLADYNSVCNFTGLLQSIESCATDAGLTELVMRYTGNSQSIDSSWSQLWSPATQTQTRGKAAGELIRILANWGI